MLTQPCVESHRRTLREAGNDDAIGRYIPQQFLFDQQLNHAGGVDDPLSVMFDTEVTLFDVIPGRHDIAAVQRDGHGWCVGEDKADSQRIREAELRNDGLEIMTVCAKPVQPDDACSRLLTGLNGDRGERVQRHWRMMHEDFLSVPHGLCFNFGMTKCSNHKHLHILGVCGTAMAAIAALAQASGWRVTGSDAGVYPPMSDYLRELGISIAPFDAANLIPAPDLCVIGNAMSRGNVEVEAILDGGLPYCSGPEFMGNHILPGRHALVVAGTHGKTTTSSLLAHVLEVAGHAPGFLIGGVPENFGGGARMGDADAPFVLEGDEYDTAFFDKRSKFLHYHARTLILNNLEYDHADIFPDLEAIKTQFHHLVRTVPSSGLIVVNADEPELLDLLGCGCWTPVQYFAQFGHATAEWQWRVDCDDGTGFTLFHHGEVAMQLQWQMIGRHNVANACAVAAAASALGVAWSSIATALQSFAGIRRRMTLVGEVAGVHVYDDFAHHPTAIAGVVQAAKAMMQRRGWQGHLWVIVEPRSNTMRTRIHQARLPLCFDGADRVLFAAPSTRNLQQDEVLDAALVCRQIGAHAELFAHVDAIVERVAECARAGDVVLVLSNGGFEGIHQRLLTAIGAQTTRSTPV